MPSTEVLCGQVEIQPTGVNHMGEPGLPYYKLLFGDFITQFKHLNINWTGSATKEIHKLINDNINGGLIEYKHVICDEEHLQVKTSMKKSYRKTFVTQCG